MKTAESFQKFAYSEVIPHIPYFQYRIISGSSCHEKRKMFPAGKQTGNIFLLPMASVISAVPPTGNGRTGTVAVAVLMVITAILALVMHMSSCLGTSFYRTDRTAGINRRPSVMSVMPVSKNRHRQKACEQNRGHNRGKPSAKMHASPLLPFPADKTPCPVSEACLAAVTAVRTV